MEGIINSPLFSIPEALEDEVPPPSSSRRSGSKRIKPDECVIPVHLQQQDIIENVLIDSGVLEAIRDTNAKLGEVQQRQLASDTTANALVSELSQTIHRLTATLLNHDNAITQQRASYQTQNMTWGA